MAKIIFTVQCFKNAPRERSGKTGLTSVPLRVLRFCMSTHDIETTVTHAGDVALLTRHFPFQASTDVRSTGKLG